MRVVAAILCDFASIRESTLMIVSGGITRLNRIDLPASLGASLALVIEVPPSDRAVPHELAVEITGPLQGPIAKIDGGFQVGTGSAFDPDESALVPVALDLRMVSVREAGWHSIAISVDSSPGATVRFRVDLARPAAVPAVSGARRPSPITH